MESINAAVWGLIVGAVVLGYLIAFFQQKSKSSAVTVQLEQAQQALAQANNLNETGQSEIKNLTASLHEKDLQTERLQAQLESYQTTETRLMTELSDGKKELESINNKLVDVTSQHNETGKRLEAANAEVRSQVDRVKDLSDRLAQREEELKIERKLVSDLKDAIAQEGKKSESLESKVHESDKYIKELKDAIAEEKVRIEDVQKSHQELVRVHTQLKTEQDEREASHARELATFEKQKEALTEQFKLLSNEILEAKAKSLQESSKQTLSSVMSPFQQSIDNFKKEVQEIHHRETSQQGELRQELASLKELNQKITTEAHELSTALRGQKKLQGNWGELVLENVLDRSGLQKGKDYDREVSIITEEGRSRPDAIVYLPQEKHLIIDAKVSLNAYTRFVNAEDEIERAQALKEHVAAVAGRIKELADRDYYKLPGLNSPEMVFMFIPIESAFVEALKADETLFQQAIENNVLVATPTTLLTSLNIVRQLWRYEDQNKHTAELANKAEAVFKKLNGFLQSFEKIKKGIEAANDAYSKAEGQLVSGRGNLVKQVGEFKNLAPAIKDTLPAYFTEKADLEIDFIPAESNQNYAAIEHETQNEIHELEETN
jgi:DNA recombination protein RmuC